MSKDKFERFICRKNDLIDNAAFSLINALLGTSSCEEEVAEWNIELIGDVVDMVDTYLREAQGLETCHPFTVDDGDTPCYLSGDCINGRCQMCRKENDE